MQYNCSSTNDRQQCSNHGYYCDDILILECICDKDYWSSHSYNPPPDRNLQCDIFILGASIFDSICILTSLVSSIIIFRIFIVPIYFKGKIKGKSLFPMMFFISIIFNLVESVENLLDDEKSTENNPGFLYGPFFVFFGNWGLILYFFTVLNFLRTYNGYITRDIIIETDMFNDIIRNLAIVVASFRYLVYHSPNIKTCSEQFFLLGVEFWRCCLDY
jgi:hypothetical protein